jgi:hypothetical protein
VRTSTTKGKNRKIKGKYDKKEIKIEVLKIA